MGFDITSKDLPGKMYAGMIITKQLEGIFAYREKALKRGFPIKQPARQFELNFFEAG